MIKFKLPIVYIICTMGILLCRGRDMPGSFGEITLSIHSYLDGCILSYGMPNTVIPNEISDFKKLYDIMLADYIESQSFISKNFLDICVSNYENIINHNFLFLTSEYKVKE